jgi:hypothetical protein
MAYAGPSTGGAPTDDSSTGTIAWTNPGNAQYVTNNPATAAVTSGASTHYLNCQGFVFAIPSTATVQGILVNVKLKTGSGLASDNRVRLIKGGTIQGVADRAGSAVYGSSYAVNSYGSGADLWNNTWQPSDINAAGFGVAFSALGAGTDTVSVAGVTITVFYAAPKDLITINRAMAEIGGYVPGTNDTLVASLVTSLSDAIEKYCRRRFLSTAYDELYNGNGDRRLLLRQYPIQSVKSVRYRPVTVLKVQNTSTFLNQQARVAVTSTGLQCSRVASGVAVTETLLTWATYPTLSALAAAVTALGNGWQGQIVGDATVSGDYGLWPSADLYVPGSYGDALESSGVLQSQGALTARGQYAELKMHTYELAGYQWDVRGWLLRAIPYTDPELLHPEDLVWPNGINNFRVQYTAGYTSVPEAVQEACAIWVSQRYFAALRDPQLQKQIIAGAITTNYGMGTADREPPPAISALLAPYRRHTVGIGQG